MCAGHEQEIELVKKELFKAGIVSETRRHPKAEGLGANGLELWVQNEQDFPNASETPPNPNIETSEAPGSGPKLQAEPSGNPPKHVGKVESIPVIQPSCLELKEASSLLQKGIEQMLLHESELTGECASLHSNVEKLTQALAQAQADVLSEFKKREAVEHNQTTRLSGILDTLTRERQEWQEKLKASDDALKSAKEQVTSLSWLLQAQQAAATTLKQEVAALGLQREQQEQCLSDVRKETDTERQARLAAEQRASFAEDSLQTQWAERQELERQIQAHAASLGSLLARVTSQAAAGNSNP